MEKFMEIIVKEQNQPSEKVILAFNKYIIELIKELEEKERDVSDEVI